MTTQVVVRSTLYLWIRNGNRQTFLVVVKCCDFGANHHIILEVKGFGYFKWY